MGSFFYFYRMKISNQKLTATFKSLGAELISLVKNSTKQEYIWQADPSHWARHTPVLFPFVGKLKGDSYSYNGKKYASGQHGFARDKDFEIIHHTSDEIAFELVSDAETLKNYPFEFRLIIRYTLEDNFLKTAYEVENLSKKEMLFSIGGHPAFNCPMVAGERRSDYHLKFNVDEPLNTHLLVNGQFSGETETVDQNDGILPISDQLFDKDALVFKGLKSDKITIANTDTNWMTFHFPGFPYLGIWSKSQTSPFVCIEPWYGLADSALHEGDLITKEGIKKLKYSAIFRCAYSVEIH